MHFRDGRTPQGRAVRHVAGRDALDDFRGPEFVELGVQIAEFGYLDPRIIRDAARTGRYEVQNLKKVWHCLARFGAPQGAGAAGTAVGGHTPGVSTPSA